MKISKEGSVKYSQILKAIPKVCKMDKLHTLYELIEYGLSTNILKLLQENKIGIEDIDDGLIKYEFITNSTYYKIVRSYEKYIFQTHMKKKIFDKDLYRVIKSKFDYSEFSYDELISIMSNLNYDCGNISNLIKILREKKQLKFVNGKYFLTRLKLRQALDSINDRNGNYDIVLKNYLVIRLKE